MASEIPTNGRQEDYEERLPELWLAPVTISSVSPRKTSSCGPAAVADCVLGVPGTRRSTPSPPCLSDSWFVDQLWPWYSYLLPHCSSPRGSGLQLKALKRQPQLLSVWCRAGG